MNFSSGSSSTGCGSLLTDGVSGSSHFTFSGMSALFAVVAIDKGYSTCHIGRIDGLVVRQLKLQSIKIKRQLPGDVETALDWMWQQDASLL